MVTINDILQGLGPAWFTLAPVASGLLVSNVSRWIPDEAAMEQRVNQCRAVVIERCCTLHHTVLSRAIELGLSSMDPAKLFELRGMPPAHPDLIGSHAKAVWSAFRVLGDLDSILDGTKRAQTMLMFSVLTAMVFFLIAVLWVDGRMYLVAGSVLIVVGQMAVVAHMHRLKRKLQNHEHKNQEM